MRPGDNETCTIPKIPHAKSVDPSEHIQYVERSQGSNPFSCACLVSFTMPMKKGCSVDTFTEGGNWVVQSCFGARG